MGGRPISSLSIVGFPEKGDPALLEQIIRGGLAKMNEASCSVIGGHSIRNEDMLFGYAVTGLINPQRVWRNVGAREGDALLFTKPLGTGVITTALKKDRATEQSLAAAVSAMTTLNVAAAAALQEIDEKSSAPSVHAVTDVTGFSLLGHAREMALGDPPHGIPAVSFEIDHSAFDYFRAPSKPRVKVISPADSRTIAPLWATAPCSRPASLPSIRICSSTRKLRADC